MDNAAQTKTPADFEASAKDHNEKVAANRALRAEVEKESDTLNERRNALIADAKTHGVTPSYARILLERA